MDRVEYIKLYVEKQRNITQREMNKLALRKDLEYLTFQLDAKVDAYEDILEMISDMEKVENEILSNHRQRKKDS
jgi:hypothetical protein